MYNVEKSNKHRTIRQFVKKYPNRPESLPLSVDMTNICV